MSQDDIAGPAVAQLTVFGAHWCPDVKRSRALLDRAEIPYRYVDVERDPAGETAVRRLQAGRRRIPTLLWPDGSFMVEPSDEQLAARLAIPP